MARGSTLAERANVMWPAATTRRRQRRDHRPRPATGHITQSGTEQRQGRRLRALQGLPPGRVRAAVDPGARGRGDARLAPTVRQEVVLVRLLTHARAPGGRGATALERRELAAGECGHGRRWELAGGAKGCWRRCEQPRATAGASAANNGSSSSYITPARSSGRRAPGVLCRKHHAEHRRVAQDAADLLGLQLEPLRQQEREDPWECLDGANIRSHEPARDAVRPICSTRSWSTPCTSWSRGQDPGPASSMLKILGTEWGSRPCRPGGSNADARDRSDRLGSSTPIRLTPAAWPLSREGDCLARLARRARSRRTARAARRPATASSPRK
jgi:hypothetical protein